MDDFGVHECLEHNMLSRPLRIEPHGMSSTCDTNWRLHEKTQNDKDDKSDLEAPWMKIKDIK